MQIIFNIYTVILISFLFFSICYSDYHTKIVSNRIIFWILGIFLLCLAGFRYGIETDYWNYKEIFDFTNSNKDYNKGVEIGFSWFILQYKRIFSGENFNGFVFLIASISIGLKLLCIKQYKKPFLALFIYFVWAYFMLEFNTIRQGLAISFLFFAVEYLKKNNKLGYFICVCIATLIHTSSFLFLFGLFFYKKKFNFCSLILIIFVSILISRTLSILIGKIIGIINIPFFSLFARKFLGYMKTNNRLISIGLFRRIVMIFLIYFLFQGNNKKSLENIYFNYYLFGSILFIIFQQNIVLSNRLSLSFEMFIIPLLANSNIKKTYKNFACLSLIIFLAILLFYTNLSKGGVIPYQTYLFD